MQEDDSFGDAQRTSATDIMDMLVQKRAPEAIEIMCRKHFDAFGIVPENVKVLYENRFNRPIEPDCGGHSFAWQIKLQKAEPSPHTTQSNVSGANGAHPEPSTQHQPDTIPEPSPVAGHPVEDWTVQQGEQSRGQK